MIEDDHLAILVLPPALGGRGTSHYVRVRNNDTGWRFFSHIIIHGRHA